MLNIVLATQDDTQTLGAQLARALMISPIAAIYLYGPLGCGKTTLTQKLVQALPGGESAEVASPSFAIFHQYPTTPPIIHCDLYRCQSAIPEDLLEILEDESHLAIIEWPEFLPTLYHAREYLDIYINACEKNRVLTIKPTGMNAEKLCYQLACEIRPSCVSDNAS